MPPPHHHLLKRAEEDLLMPKPVIVLLIMFGACALTCLGYAMHKLIGFGTDDNGVKPMSQAQYEYMAEVKVRNLEALAREGRLAWHGDRNRRGNETVYSEGSGM